MMARLPSLPRLLPTHSHTQWLFFTYKAGLTGRQGFTASVQGEGGRPPGTLSPNSMLKDAMLPRQRSAYGQPRTSPTDHSLFPPHTWT